MARRRRRRGRGKGASSQPKPEAKTGQQGGPVSSASSRRRRRRGRRAPIGPQATAEETMARPKTLQTLPPDGVVLEQVISAMKDEYGPPATPQEYRLVIKTPAPEEIPESVVSQQAEGDDSRAAPQPARRRRRRRRRSGAVESDDVRTEPEDPQEIPPVT